MAYRIILSNHFKKDAKKLSKKQIDKTKAVIQMIADGEVLPVKYSDHQLKGELKEYRDCHVEPDLVLIYKLEDEILTLTAFRVGSHSYLF
ncbi:MAG: type II toxin-antitoxin system YafQ family toxin [Spirochaetales bacterium]|nr:type II toxin-antitoxin system YafQ family toxin [Spirochaetales bacterium]